MKKIQTVFYLVETLNVLNANQIMLK